MCHLSEDIPCAEEDGCDHAVEVEGKGGKAEVGTAEGWGSGVWVCGCVGVGVWVCVCVCGCGCGCGCAYFSLFVPVVERIHTCYNTVAISIVDCLHLHLSFSHPYLLAH